MRGIDNARLVCCCFGLNDHKDRHGKTKAQDAPLEERRWEMARINDAGLVCCCIGWKADMIVSICMQKPNHKVHPWKGKWQE